MFSIQNVTVENLTFAYSSSGDCHASPHAPACDADEGAVAQRAVVVGGASKDVKLASLTFRAIGGFALYASETSGLTIEHISAVDVGSGGIFVRNCPGVLINNSIIKGYGQVLTCLLTYLRTYLLLTYLLINTYLLTYLLTYSGSPLLRASR